MIFDTHAHYNDEAFDEDRDELLKSLPENGVELVVNVGANLSSTEESIALAEQGKSAWIIIGMNRTGRYRRNGLPDRFSWQKNAVCLLLSTAGMQQRTLLIF